MSATVFLVLFLSFFLVEFVINRVLDVLNQRSIDKNSEVPDFFKNLVDTAAYKKSQNYTTAKLKFNKWQML